MPQPPLAYRPATAALSFAIAIGLASACSDDTTNATAATAPCTEQTGGSIGLDKSATTQLTVNATGLPAKSGDTLAAAPPLTAVGQTVTTELTLRNIAGAVAGVPLTLRALELVPPDGSAPSADWPFACNVVVAGQTLACADATKLPALISASQKGVCTGAGFASELTIRVQFTKPAAAQSYAANLRLDLRGDSKFDSPAGANWDVPFVVHFAAKPAVAKAQIQPTLIDFATAKLGSVATRDLTIAATGDADLVISAVDFTAAKLASPGGASPAFTLVVGDRTFSSGKVANLSDQPIVVGHGQVLAAQVTYAPSAGDADHAVLRLVTNAPNVPPVQLLGNTSVPCLLVKPAAGLDFGYLDIGGSATRTVQLINCGATAVHVTGHQLTGDATAFSVQGASTAAGPQPPPTAAQPLELTIGESATITVACVPPNEKHDAQGAVAPWTGQLKLADDSILPDKTVPLTCWGSALACPTPIIVAGEGTTVPPQSPMHLLGSPSYALGGKKITSYKWTLLAAPQGATAVAFWPSPSAPDPQLGVQRNVVQAGIAKTIVALDVAGEYKVQLVVTDSAGVGACAAATATILVVPDTALFVQLLWITPADKTHDTGPGAGADLDLHFAHPNAQKAKICTNPPTLCGGKPCLCQPDLDGDGKADAFFHPLYDCYWANPQPNWGNVDPAVPDDPSLDLDDTDGWGPENLHLQAPSYGGEYALAVHYWDAHELGPSVAKLLVYANGALQATLLRSLNECDMWQAGAVAWPSGKVVNAGSDPTQAGKVVPGYKATGGKLNGKCVK